MMQRIARNGNRLIALLLVLILTIAIAACGQAQPDAASASADTASVQTTSAETAASTEATPEATPSATPEATPVAKPDKDRAGNAIALPAVVKTIVSHAPSFTEILIAMGLADRIVAIEQNAVALEGVKAEWPVFDMMAPDTEKLLALKPDVLFASPMSTGGGEDPFKSLRDAGICVVYVPSSDSIQGIMDDLVFVGAVTGATEAAQKLVDGMKSEIDAISAIGKTIAEKKSVYFEIAAAPSMYSFGSGVFLNEMIEMIGAKNVLADQKSWIAVTDEVAVAADPDVILTNVSYLPDPVGEIKARAGWSAMKAVKGNQVFQIDNMASSLPDHNIVKALRQMAKAVYPDLY